MVYRMSNLKSKAFCIWCDLVISKILDDRFRHLMVYCSTVASWSNPSDLLKEKIIKVLIDLLFFVKYQLSLLVESCSCSALIDLLLFLVNFDKTLLLFKNRYGGWMDFVASIPSDTLDRMKILYGDVFS